MAYALAALSHVIARVFRGPEHGIRRASRFSGRCWQRHPRGFSTGLVAGSSGRAPLNMLVGLLLLLAFLTIWGICLREAERGPEAETAP
jgi:hypothetical protein